MLLTTRSPSARPRAASPLSLLAPSHQRPPHVPAPPLSQGTPEPPSTLAAMGAMAVVTLGASIRAIISAGPTSLVVSLCISLLILWGTYLHRRVRGGLGLCHVARSPPRGANEGGSEGELGLSPRGRRAPRRAPPGPSLHLGLACQRSERRSCKPGEQTPVLNGTELSEVQASMKTAFVSTLYPICTAPRFSLPWHPRQGAQASAEPGHEYAYIPSRPCSPLAPV